MSGPGIDHRHRQVLREVSVRLVHRGRAEADDVGTVLDTLQARLDEFGEDDVLLAAEEIVEIWRCVDRADRGALVYEAVLLELLLVEGDPAVPLGQDRELVA